MDVPELGYYANENRGEILVQSDAVIPGYYKNEEKNRESFQDGWFKTGDIGEMDPQTGRLKIIDRKKAMFKLNHGEYVAPTVLENLFMRCEYIEQICVYGDSYRNFCIAVVVPNEGTLRAWITAQQSGESYSHNSDNQSFEDLCKRQDVNDLILHEIVKIGTEFKKPAYEIPRAILVEHERFTESNGLLTGSAKLCRHKLIKYYAQRFFELYERLETQNVQYFIHMAIQQTLGLSEIPDGSNFIDLGGDSLSAAKISNMLEKQGIKLTPAQLLVQNVNVSSLHLTKPEEKIQIDQEVNSLMQQIPLVTRDTLIINRTINILLTGSTGFLGTHLIQALLRRNPQLTIYCVIRAKDDHTAALRQQEALNKMGIKLDVSNNLVCLAGDLSKPLLGLSTDTWTLLIEKIDAIYHNGARVNFQLSYPQLKNENVLSLVELLKLSIQGPLLKPLFFVSTMSIFNFSSKACMENEILSSNDEMQQNFNYMQGYPQTKLICEVLLQRLSLERRFNHVAIFRTQMIGGSLIGAMNTEDWVCRLIVGVILSRIAPQSYESSILMITVDYVSDALAYLTSDPVRISTLKSKAFNLMHWDEELSSQSELNISKLFDDIGAYGYQLALLPQQEWYNRMEALAMSQPPVTSKNNPIIPLLPSFSNGIVGSRHVEYVMGATNTKSLLSSSDVYCHRIDSKLVFKWLDWLVKQELIPAP